MNEWHYEKNGERLGGVSQDEIGALISMRSINGQTLVWKQGFVDWTPLRNTELATYLNTVDSPPALPASRINNVWVWLLAAAPFLGGLLEGFISGVFSSNEYMLEETLANHRFWYVTLLLNIALSITDERSLKKAGVDTKKFGKVVFIIPVYLWKRAKALNQKTVYFWVWVVLFVLSLFSK